MKKYFVFSDVHGECKNLIESLNKKGFEADNQNHVLISLGDNFDRGSENVEVLEFLLKYNKQGRLIAVLGNHDKMLLDFITGVDDAYFNAVYNGLDQTIADLSGVKEINYYLLQADPDFYIDKIKRRFPGLLRFLKNMKLKGIELDKYVMTHGGYSIVNNYFFEDDEVEWIVDNWAKTNIFVDQFNPGDKIYIFGHWHARLLRRDFGQEINDETFIYSNFIGIDAATNASGFVNIYVIETDSEPISITN